MIEERNKVHSLQGVTSNDVVVIRDLKKVTLMARFVKTVVGTCTVVFTCKLHGIRYSIVLEAQFLLLFFFYPCHA